jgi:hypothetical protein
MIVCSFPAYAVNFTHDTEKRDEDGEEEPSYC